MGATAPSLPIAETASVTPARRRGRRIRAALEDDLGRPPVPVPRLRFVEIEDRRTGHRDREAPALEQEVRELDERPRMVLDAVVGGVEEAQGRGHSHQPRAIHRNGEVDERHSASEQ